MSTRLEEKLDSLAKAERVTPIQLKRKLLALIGDPWEQARGLFEKHKQDSLRYQKKIRQEWQ